jgi:ATP-dependent RNA helicase SUPV3L1/SUV3
MVIKDAEKELAEAIVAHKALCMTSDLRIPHEWYPYARLIKRKIYYHGGPTNSGKTYRALQRLKAADPAKGGGMYCGPLRLLALEVYDQLNKSGVYTDLLTGQEQRQVPFSSHISCTVEMVNLNREYDVAVIDEIQMIANEQRGFAW